MNPSHKTVYYLLALLLFVTVITGVVYYSKDLPLHVTHEVYATGITPEGVIDPVSTATVAGHGTHELPYNFRVGKVNSLTVHSPRLYTSVKKRQAILFGFNSSKPVNFTVILGESPEWGFGNYLGKDSEILVNVTESYYFFNYLKIPRNGVVTFCFESDPAVLAAHVTLKGEEASQFIGKGNFEENLGKAVDSARAFLFLNEIEAGKYLECSLEYGVPNYLWHRNQGMMYPRMPEACDYIAVRFGRPGHYLEVWVDPDTSQVVGGDTCC